MEQLNPIELFIPEIRELLTAKNVSTLRTLLAELNPIDLADGFDRFSPEEQIILFRLLDDRRQMIVFEELDLLQQEYVIHHLQELDLSGLIEGLPPRVVQHLMRKLPLRVMQKMEGHLRRGQITTLQVAKTYPPESVGALMSPVSVALNPEMTVQKALDHLRTHLKVKDEGPLQTVFVVDNSNHPVGSLSLRALVASSTNAKVHELMSPAFLVRLQALMDREDAAKIFSRYKLITAPVVNEEDRLIGTVSAGEILRVIQEEATEDIQKMSAVEALDEPYFKISFLKLVRKRGTWLCVLFLGEMLTATAMAYFEKEISRAVVLALFIPLIISSGGNSGSQAATIIVRAMALREVGFRDWWRVMRREFAVGLALGCTLGTIGFFRIFLWSQFSTIYGPHYFLIALTVACSLVFVVLWGSLSGSLLPMVLRKLGLDPAVVSAPFVATLVDVTGLVIYFVTGMLILKGTLL